MKYYFLIFIFILSGCAKKDIPKSHKSSSCFNYCSQSCLFNNHEMSSFFDVPSLDNNKIILKENEILSPGDVIDIDIMHNKDISSKYIVKSNGYIYLPWIEPIKAAGVSINKLKQKIKDQYVSKDIFKENTFYIIVQVVKYAPISIKINGEVFKPGLVIINKNDPLQNQYKDVGISHVDEKMLTLALKLAGGVKPTANLRNVKLVRDNQEYYIDLTNIFNNKSFEDVPLIDGDEIHVDSLSCVDEDLIQLSRITPVGIKLYISNTTTPVYNNNSGNINKAVTEMPYGTRLIDVAFNANCMGGTEVSNSDRSFLLISSLNDKNKLVSMKISAYDLIKYSNDIQYNPHLMNGDKITCFDSGMTNYAAVIKLITDSLSPINILHGLIGW